MKVLAKKFVVTTTLSFCALLTSANTVKKIKKEIKNTPYKVNDNDYPVICKQYHVFREGDDLQDLTKVFSTSVSGLERLNPEFDDIYSVDVGMPLCVVGRMSKVVLQHEGNKKGEEEKIGKRPKNLVKYNTIPGTDNCKSILENSAPPLSQLRFVELNPGVDCQKMEKKSLKIVLPEGTSITKSSQKRNARYGNSQNYDQECLMGPWSEWSSCENGGKTRSRNVYQEASGKGKACSASSQTETCKDSSVANSSKALEGFRASSSSNQCINKAYDGCSNPLFNYEKFAPACNFHDFCWACRDQWNINKEICDNYFLYLQYNTCENYWRCPFDRWWCNLTAEIQYIGVTFVSPSYDYPETCPSVSTVLNAKLSGSNIGYVVPSGCDCLGRSCDYRGEPYPCWSTGTICGAGTTCNNCCNDYSWWWSKFFTACD